jgi:Kef-type K+ transport system membrane component KefB/Trk K+ transport system NAD-binding subunit
MDETILGAIGGSIIAAAVLALVARYLRQPLILGYIVGGALLGPHVGFGLITDQHQIELIAEMGLILLLFIIGLEISLPQVMQAGRTISVSGLLEPALCGALAWLVFLGPGFDDPGRFDRLYLAVALALSSTLIVVKLLYDKQEMSTFGGRVTVGILVFQDLWAIAFLALQPNLDNLQPAPLLRSLALGAALVVAAALLSRYVLSRLFRAIATSTELMLVTSMAWCFLVSAVAAWAGLSTAMGALVAGMVIAAFPYGTEVISRLSGVRDFFITLFFVALGLQIPWPSARLLVLAALAAAFVVASRFLVVYPIFVVLRLDLRTAGVVAVNLAQVSEFSLVIVALGTTYGHVGPEVGSLVLYTMLLTSLISTYGIRWNHEIATAVARALSRAGVPAWIAARGRGQPPDAAPPAPAERKVFLLGVSREGLAFLEHLERERPEMKRRIVAIDFNPETLDRLQAGGVECHYGDVANVEMLRHAHIEQAGIVVSALSDWVLRGTNNSTLLRLIRGLAPSASIIVTADTLAGAERLYAEGADYVLIPPALAAEHLYELLREESPAAIRAARRRQAGEIFERPRGPAS